MSAAAAAGFAYAICYLIGCGVKGVVLGSSGS
jgi:hypothetical protein